MPTLPITTENLSLYCVTMQKHTVNTVGLVSSPSFTSSSCSAVTKILILTRHRVLRVIYIIWIYYIRIIMIHTTVATEMSKKNLLK